MEEKSGISREIIIWKKLPILDVARGKSLSERRIHVKFRISPLRKVPQPRFKSTIRLNDVKYGEARRDIA